MTSGISVPKLNDKIVCVVGKDDLLLAAIVSSFFVERDTYFPIFIFPEVNTSYSEINNDEDDDFISQMIGTEAGVLINNALARIGGCDHLIYLGLDDQQKSYFQKLPKSINKISIQEMSEIKAKLAFLGLGEREMLICKPSQVLEGLFLAKHENKMLVVENDAEDIGIPPRGEGLVLIERTKNSFPIIAINYAFSINAAIKIVEPLDNGEPAAVLSFIQKWRKLNNHNQLQKVKNKIQRRIEGEDFSSYKFLTCFTEGLPYSLVLKNILPISHVHLLLRVDFFIFNNIVSEYIERFNSALIFSPGYFGADEETDKLIKFLKRFSFQVKFLLDGDATVYNFDFFVSHFPYDILHICSHGGEVDGYTVAHDFTDRKGEKHTVEYDEVVGFAPIPGKDRITVHSKIIFKKFDDLRWMSPELRAKKMPDYIFEDMRKALHVDKSQKNLKRVWRSIIPTSCAIKCYDSIHQGMFRTIASQNSPIVFNNTCWSWFEVATFFLSAGGRGYLGTLWNVGNQTAILAAKTFYTNIFKGTILDAFFEMTKAIKESADKDIYIYWGLHFSTIFEAINPEESRKKVFKELAHSLLMIVQKIKTSKMPRMKERYLEIAKLINSEIKNNFSDIGKKYLYSELGESLAKIIAERSNQTPIDTEPTLQEQRSIDLHTEFKEKSKK